MKEITEKPNNELSRKLRDKGFALLPNGPHLQIERDEAEEIISDIEELENEIHELNLLLSEKNEDSVSFIREVLDNVSDPDNVTDLRENHEDELRTTYLVGHILYSLNATVEIKEIYDFAFIDVPKHKRLDTMLNLAHGIHDAKNGLTPFENDENYEVEDVGYFIEEGDEEP